MFKLNLFTLVLFSVLQPSRALSVKGLARSTNGYFVFIAPNTNVDIYVAEQLARALQPNIVDVHVKWNTNQHILHKVPEHAPPVFVGDRLLFYALLDQTMPFDHTTTVELLAGSQQKPIGLACIDHVPAVLESQTIMRLAAKALLRELLNTEESSNKESLITLSLKYGILCPHTAFIGIERRLNGNTNMELREVPIMIDKSCSNLQRMSSLIQLQQQISNIQDCISSSQDFMCIESLSCSSKMFYKKSKRRSAWGNPISSVVRSTSNFFSSLFTKNENSSQPAVNCDVVPPPVYASNSTNSQITNVAWPTEEQKLVDRFIDLQQYDGLWKLTADDVKQLTGKPLTTFSSSIIQNMPKDRQELIITTVIVILILEVRCSSLKTLWQALSNKAQKRLKELLGVDETQIEQLIKDIRDQF